MERGGRRGSSPRSSSVWTAKSCQLEAIRTMTLVAWMWRSLGESSDAAGGGGVGDVEAGLGEGGWGPDVGEGAAAVVGDPEAGVLGVPAAGEVGIGGVGVVVDGGEGDAGGVGAVPAEETDVVHEGVGTCAPECAYGPGVDAVGVEADAGDDVGASLRGFKEGFGRAGTLEGGGGVGDDELGGGGS